MSKLDENPSLLSAYLQPSISSARMERNRAAIQRRLQRPAYFGGLSLLAAAACAAALVLAIWGPLSRLTGRHAPAPIAWQPAADAVLEAHAQAVAAALEDGTRLDLAPQTTVTGLQSEPGKVELELRRGRASFDVTHDPARQFRVRAGKVTVVVLGTRFSVGRFDGVVTVAVERGKVAVETGGRVAYLTPGQSWQGPEHGDPEAVLPPEERPPSDVSSRATAAGEPSASTRPATATTVAKPNGSAATAVEAEAAPNPAKQLFDASREARRVGDSRRAAQLLQQLVSQYASDPRAGLAAFELGRIRADVLGDLTGAISALEQALRLSPQGGFRQDALARLAHAYDRVGRSEDCRAMRQRYLAAYGEGVHAQRVLKLCR